MRGAEMRGAEPRLPTRTASARRVRPLLRERERPVRSTAVPGGLRARVPCHAAAQRAALGLRSPEPARPVLGPSGADAARSGPAPAPPARRGVAAAAACVCSSAHPQLGMLRGCEMLSAPCARGPRGLCSAGVSAGAGGRAAPRGGAPRAFTHVSVGPRGAAEPPSELAWPSGPAAASSAESGHGLSPSMSLQGPVGLPRGARVRVAGPSLPRSPRGAAVSWQRPGASPGSAAGSAVRRSRVCSRVLPGPTHPHVTREGGVAFLQTPAHPQVLVSSHESLIFFTAPRMEDSLPEVFSSLRPAPQRNRRLWQRRPYEMGPEQ